MAALVSLGSIAAPLLVWDGGLVETETTYFIQRYLDGRSVVRKVFDPHGNDLQTYQARELSYSIDCLDAHVFRLLLTKGIVVLIPFSNAVAPFLTVAAFSWGTLRVAPHLGSTTMGLMLLVYVTNFVHLVTAGVFYRSAKPLLAPTLLAALFYVYDVVSERRTTLPDRPRFFTRSFFAVVGFGCVLSLLDRQGFFYTVVLLAALLFVAVFRRNCLDLLSGAFLATCLMVLYNVAIGPWIIHQVNGYWPSFHYQRLSTATLLAEPSRFMRQAIELLSQSARVLLGSFPIWVYAVGAGVCLAVTALGSPSVSSQSRTWLMVAKRYMWPALLIAVVVASQVVMFALMILRHQPVYDWPDHRLWYYPLPYQAVLLFGMTLLVGRVLRRDKQRVVVVNFVLAIVVIGNVSSWREHRDVLLRSPWFPTVDHQSVLLKKSLRDRTPAPDLNKAYGGFYEYCVRRMPARSRLAS